MKALIVTPIFKPSPGGASEDFLNISDILLSSYNVHVTILSSSIDGDRKTERKKRLTVKRHLNRRGDFFENFFENEKEIKNEISNNKYDLIIFHSNVLFFRASYSEILKGYNGTVILYKSDLVPINSYEVFDYVISISDGITRFLIKDGCYKDKIIQLPILFKKPKVNKKTKRPLKENYIFFPGGGNQLKGAYELFKGFRLFKEETRSDLKLVVGWGAEGFEDFFKDIIFVGPLRKKEMIKYIYFSELVILPSYTEGLPRTMLESFSLKKKVIFTDRLVPEFSFLKECSLLKKITPDEIKERLAENIFGNCKLQIVDISRIIKSSFPKKEWEDVFKKIIFSPKKGVKERKFKTESLPSYSRLYKETSKKRFKKYIEEIFYNQKFWGKERELFLKEALRLYKKRFKDLPDINFVKKLMKNLKFKNSHLFYEIGMFYLELEKEKEGKYFLKKALGFYPQNYALLSFVKLFENFSLKKGELKIIEKAVKDIVKDSSKERISDFLIVKKIKPYDRILQYLKITKKDLKERITYHINKNNPLYSFYSLNFLNLWEREEEKQIIIKRILGTFTKKDTPDSAKYELLMFLLKNKMEIPHDLIKWLKNKKNKKEEDFLLLFRIYTHTFGDVKTAKRWLNRALKVAYEKGSFSYYKSGLLYYEVKQYEKAKRTSFEKRKNKCFFNSFKNMEF